MNSKPSPLIDSAICDLISTISQFSDDNFDANWLNLTEEEVELLVISSIKAMREKLDGGTLGAFLLEIRSGFL